MLYIHCQILSEIEKNRDEKPITISLFAPRINCMRYFPLCGFTHLNFSAAGVSHRKRRAKDYRIIIHIPLNSPSRNCAMGIKI